MNGVTAPFGFKPARKFGAGTLSGAQNTYAIASAYATSLFYGDPVTMLSDGTIGIGVAGAPCLGIFLGCKYQLATADTIGNTYRTSSYWPASTTVKTGTVVEALVCDDPDMVFYVQETAADGTAGTALALADRNLNINFVVGAGNTATGQSTTTINNASENTTVSLNMRLLDLAPIVGNVVGSYAVWAVAWNSHLLKGGVGSTGV